MPFISAAVSPNTESAATPSTAPDLMRAARRVRAAAFGGAAAPRGGQVLGAGIGVAAGGAAYAWASTGSAGRSPPICARRR